MLRYGGNCKQQKADVDAGGWPRIYPHVTSTQLHGHRTDFNPLSQLVVSLFLPHHEEGSAAKDRTTPGGTPVYVMVTPCKVSRDVFGFLELRTPCPTRIRDDFELSEPQCSHSWACARGDALRICKTTPFTLFTEIGKSIHHINNQPVISNPQTQPKRCLAPQSIQQT